jgi:hypothetical protein
MNPPPVTWTDLSRMYGQLERLRRYLLQRPEMRGADSATVAQQAHQLGEEIQRAITHATAQGLQEDLARRQRLAPARTARR